MSISDATRVKAQSHLWAACLRIPPPPLDFLHRSAISSSARLGHHFGNVAFPLKRFHQSLFVFQFLIVSHSPPIHTNVNGVLGHDHCLQISEWEVATKTTYNTNV